MEGIYAFLNSNRSFAFSVSITEVQQRWEKITNNIVLDKPKNGSLILLNAFNPSRTLIKKVYVNARGELYNTDPPLDKGNWFISGAYKSK